jgi:hypothetical protein
MDRTISKRGRDEKCIQIFSRENLKGETVWEPYCRWEDNIKRDPKEIVSISTNYV